MIRRNIFRKLSPRAFIDAENALAQTRFEHLQAKVDARMARIRLDHSIGRDVK